ncbi:unnamed protein product [Sphagnum compactum]
MVVELEGSILSSDGLCALGGELGFPTMEGSAAAGETCLAFESHHEGREDMHTLVGIGHWPEELFFQELAAQLLVSKHLQGNARLGSVELVQLRRLFQETRGRLRLLDTQIEVKDLEAEMRDLKVEEGTEVDAAHQGKQQQRKGRMRNNLETVDESLQLAARRISDSSADIIGADLETKLQLGEMEFEEEEEEEEEEKLETESRQQRGGKRRTCFGVAVSKLDLKKSRHDLPSFANLILEDRETQ